MPFYETFSVPPEGYFVEPVSIYTGILGQIGDIVMFTATARRIKEIFPNGTLTFAVSKKYREAGELIKGLPYVDRLYVTEHYFELRKDTTYQPWHRNWPADCRGHNEVAEQRRHDIILETRPQHRRMPWWHYAHLIAELAHQVGVPGPIDLRTEIAIPDGTTVPDGACGKVVPHNDPSIDSRKAWPWESVREFVRAVGPENVVLLGGAPSTEMNEQYVAGIVSDTLDLRGKTTLAEAAAVIREASCYVGIDSGLMWIAGSLQVPAVGLYGTSYIDAYQNIQPVNPNAEYIQVEGGLGGIRVSDVLCAVERRCCTRPV